MVSRLFFYKNVLRPIYHTDVILEAVRRGQSQWESIRTGLTSTDPFSYYKTHPELLSDLMSSMHLANRRTDELVLRGLDIRAEDQILDVGGASGGLADLILNMVPNVSRIDIYEKEEGKDLLLPLFHRLIPNKIQRKIHYHWGSFLDKGNKDHLKNLENSYKFDKIFLGWVIHDWSDETNVQILQRVKSHLKPGGQIILLEWILDDERTGPVTLNDFDMLLQSEGQERTIGDFKRLFSRAGLRITLIISPEFGRSSLVLERDE